MAYLLDANVFIEAKNRHYGLDFCPAFWDWLILSHASGRVFSIERVGDEIAAMADQLSTWAAQRGSSFFVKPTAVLFPALATVSAWATGQRYELAAVNTFLQVGDYYLVAHALAQGDTLVTHEIASTSTKKIKIPDACIALGIKCVTPYEMLRNERARFILGPNPGDERPQTRRFAGSRRNVPSVPERPMAGDVIPGSGGIRKVRWKREGTGKRGGVRVVYYFRYESIPLFLLTVYAKGRKSDLSQSELRGETGKPGGNRGRGNRGRGKPGGKPRGKPGTDGTFPVNDEKDHRDQRSKDLGLAAPACGNG